MTAAVVPLQDAERRPRRVAVGDVRRRAPRPPRGHPRRRHRRHLRAAPRGGAAPGLAAAAAHVAPAQGRAHRGLGVPEVVVVPFDSAFAARSAQDFADDVLVGALGATHVSVGENFHFGHRARASRRCCAADPRFETRVVRLLEADGEIVSSSHIRGLVHGGEVEYARAAAGRAVRAWRARWCTASSAAASWASRPRTSCPTRASPRPRTGSTRARERHARPAAVNIGVRPTFDTRLGELVEAFLLDFSGDLYGTQLELTFLSACAASSASTPSRRSSSRWTATSRPRAGSCGRAREPEAATLLRRMPLTQERKLDIISQFGESEHDTGSTRVQVALLTERINDLTQHLRTHRKDHHSRRGLLMLVGQRRRFLRYLEKNDLEGYRALIRELGLRR